MSDKFVLVDFDNTLFDFCGSLSKQLSKIGIHTDLSKSESYSFKGYDKEIRKKIFEVMHSDLEVYENLEFFEGAKESLDKLQSVIETRAYTGTSSHKEIYKKKVKPYS